MAPAMAKTAEEPAQPSQARQIETTIEEAILRHGAEALRARTGFTQLSDPEKAALMAFLKSL